MQSLFEDLRYAARVLLGRPGFAATAVVTLALGIGGTTAIFSLTSAVLLGTLPYHDPERLFMVWEDASELGFPRDELPPRRYAAFRAQSQAFDDMAALAVTGFTLTGGGEPEKVQARRVTASFFPLLGVAPQIGRVFLPEEDVPGANRVVILSHRLWKRRHGGDPGIVGRHLLLDGENYRVVGVMPPNFQFMESYVGMWVPAAFTAEELAHGSRYLDVVGRLKADATAERAQAELRTIASRLERDSPQPSFRPYLLPLREQLLGDARRPLQVLVLATSSLLLITCANVAGLLLARAASRGREIALRLAMGASRRRILRQLLTESVLLALLGAVPGILVASWALSSLEQLVPPALMLTVHPTLDARALAVSVLLAIATGLVFGLAPVLHAVQDEVGEALRRGGRGATDAGHGRLRGALVVAEFAATFVLLVGAGLFAQTLYQMRYAHLGLSPDRLLTLRTALPPNKYWNEPERRASFYEAVLDRVRHLPGVVSAGYSTSVPLEWRGGTNAVLREGDVPRPEGRSGSQTLRDANHRQVSADFLQTMGIPLRGGRFFEPADGAGAPRVAIVNETMARQYWPGVSALGKRFKIGDVGGPEAHPWITIVGVVGDVRQMGLDAPVKAEMYLPYSQINDQPWFAPRDLAVRTAGEPMSVVAAVKQAIREVAPDQPLSNIRTYDAILDEQVLERRLGSGLVAAFAALALLLAALGVYGLQSHFVAQRTAEIGVRLALGAGRRDIISLMLAKGMRLALAGVTLGVLGALALTRLVASLLYGIGAADPATFTAATLVLLAMGLVACYQPALHAAKLDPTAALRHE